MDPEKKCEAHSLAIALQLQRIETVEGELLNHKQWRREMVDKVDSIHGRITQGHERIGEKLAEMAKDTREAVAMISKETATAIATTTKETSALRVKWAVGGGIVMALAWAYTQWGPK